MRYIDLFENASEIEKILGEYFDVKNAFTINSDNSVDIEGDCALFRNRTSAEKGPFTVTSLLVDRLPIKFRKVIGSMSLASNALVTLENSPQHVGGNFSCSSNVLRSLVGGPTYVGGNFSCLNNPLRSLEGFPNYIGGEFKCTWDSNLPLLRTLIVKTGVIILTPPANSDIHPTAKIINKYRGHTHLRHAILDRQKDLIEAGFGGNARW
jgi:hypothetical protein